MPDERCHETELNRFWNALNRDIAAPAAVTLDPGQTETLRRLRDMTAATPPAAMRARVDREVRSLLDRPANGSEPVDPRQIQLFIQRPPLWQDDRPSPGAAQRPLPRPAAGRIGWAAAQLATVSLVLLALDYPLDVPVGPVVAGYTLAEAVGAPLATPASTRGGRAPASRFRKSMR